MLGPVIRRAYRILNNPVRNGPPKPFNLLTKEQLVLVYNVCHSKVNCTKDNDQGLDDTVQDGDRKNENRLRVYNTVVDHGSGIQLSKICQK
jgi:hypothetical protein